MIAAPWGNLSPPLVPTVCFRFTTKVRPNHYIYLSLTCISLAGDISMSGDDDLQDSSSSSPVPMLSDWFLNSHQSSLHLAENTRKIVCYLWLSSNFLSPRRHQFVPYSSPHTVSLRFSGSPHFIQFVQKVASVVILSLHYIYPLKERNLPMDNLLGIAFRVAAIATLMMANEFVDKYVLFLTISLHTLLTLCSSNTHTIPGIALEEVNETDCKIPLCINFSLYVNKTTYDSLFKRLVLAKENDGSVWKKKNFYTQGLPVRPARAPVSLNTSSTSHSTATYAMTPTQPHCARSTSLSSQSFRYSFTSTSATRATSRPINDQPSKPGANCPTQDALSTSSTSFPSTNKELGPWHR